MVVMKMTYIIGMASLLEDLLCFAIFFIILSIIAMILIFSITAYKELNYINLITERECVRWTSFPSDLL